MEEILASIRRIIADDEAKPSDAKPAETRPAEVKPSEVKPPESKAPPAKPAAVDKPAPPPAAAKPAAPAAKPAMKDIPPSAIAPKPAAAEAAPAVNPNSQDDIDAMLASLDAATPEADIRPSQPEADVFDLTDEMVLPEPAPAPAAASFHKIEPPDDIEFTESAAPRAQHRQPSYEPPPFESAAAAPQILSRSTVSAVESAFNSLANTVLSNNARTLEDLVKEMLRPMLKSWLDDNLPGLVERIVKAEIERVSRGR
jgi:cell pole-organizing protein PopZ